jgi:hypothetical protein
MLCELNLYARVHSDPDVSRKPVVLVHRPLHWTAGAAPFPADFAAFDLRTGKEIQ